MPNKQDTIRQFLSYQDSICTPNFAYLYRVAIRIDGGWSVRDYYVYEKTIEETGTYADDSFKIKEGKFQAYYPDGKTKRIRRYLHGKLVGLNLEYDKDGNITDSSFYNNDIPCRFSYGWWDKELAEKGIYDDKGAGQEWRYYDKGIIERYGKYTEGHQKDSVWTYYYKTGQPSCKEDYEKGTLKNRICYDENGKVQPGSCDSEIMPEPTTDMLKYITKNVDFPPGYEVSNPVKVIARFVINEDGKVTNVEVMQKVHPLFDAQVVYALKHSFPWKPGKDHNHPVRVWYTIPVVFKMAP